MDRKPFLKKPGPVGTRTIKTAATAAILAAVYYMIGRNPAFACIGVIFGMGSDMKDSIQNGGNRLVGTLIGGVLAVILFRLYLFVFPQGGHSLFLTVMLFIGIIALIQLCRSFWPGGVQPGGVVLCIVLFSTPVSTYVSYSLNRIFDTAVGVVVAVVVNWVTQKDKTMGFREEIRDFFDKLEH